MSNRTIANGADLMCFVRSGTDPSYTYKPLAGQTNCTLQRAANYRESNAKNMQGNKDFYQGLKEWDASIDMDIPDYADTNTDEVNFEDLQDYEIAGTKPTFVFAWVDNSGNEPVVDTSKPMYVGVGLVSCPLNAPNGENATTTVAIKGCLELQKVDPS